MIHPAQDRWRRYAAGELDGRDREELEAHLAACDTCLLLYMQAAGGAAELEAARADGLTDHVMNAIAACTDDAWQAGAAEAAEAGHGSELPSANALQAADEKKGGRASGARRRRKTWDARRKRTLLHYAIAVCIMLLMMSTGVFDRLAEQPEQWKAERRQEHGGSLSDALMAKTSLVLDKVLDSPRSRP